jgi:hypothetical protein
LKINCSFCDTIINFRPRLAAEDYPKDEYNQSLENMQGGVITDKSYNPKQDLVDQGWTSMDKGTRKYKRRVDLKDPADDMQGVSNVAGRVGDTIIFKCPSCKNVTVAGIPQPDAFDTYHHTDYYNKPDTQPEAYVNETHPDPNRVRSNVDVDLDKIVKKVKKYKREYKDE